jgi:hypothetical protein
VQTVPFGRFHPFVTFVFGKKGNVIPDSFFGFEECLDTRVDCLSGSNGYEFHVVPGKTATVLNHPHPSINPSML